MPHPDQKKKLSDEDALKALNKGKGPDLPPAFKTQAVDAQVDDERSMFKRAERPQEEQEPELPDPFAVQTETQDETEEPEQTRDQTELLQQIVNLLEGLPDEIGDSVADALGVNS